MTVIDSRLPLKVKLSSLLTCATPPRNVTCRSMSISMIRVFDRMRNYSALSSNQLVLSNLHSCNPLSIFTVCVRKVCTQDTICLRRYELKLTGLHRVHDGMLELFNNFAVCERFEFARSLASTSARIECVTIVPGFSSRVIVRPIRRGNISNELR